MRPLLGVDTLKGGSSIRLVLDRYEGVSVLPSINVIDRFNLVS